jgi:hypothetical protein
LTAQHFVGQRGEIERSAQEAALALAIKSQAFVQAFSQFFFASSEVSFLGAQVLSIFVRRLLNFSVVGPQAADFMLPRKDLLANAWLDIKNKMHSKMRITGLLVILI